MLRTILPLSLGNFSYAPLYRGGLRSVLYTDDMLSAARYIFAMACCAELVGVIYTRPQRVLPFRQPLAGSDGIEPSMQESNSCALPLGEPPIIPCSYCYME